MDDKGKEYVDSLKTELAEQPEEIKKIVREAFNTGYLIGQADATRREWVEEQPICFARSFE